VHLALQRGLWGYTVYRFEQIRHLKTAASVDPFLVDLMGWNRLKLHLLLRLHRSMVLLRRRRSLQNREFQLRIPR
jgi:trehalose/maltose hydrolase-like predicted phosphorylase